MKFRNQRDFMGHTISNVTNKPLLHKKGKQWIVVAVSALILAGFGGMVSTTTHADTTATQPTTTKVAPKPAINSAKATTPAPSTNNNTKPASVKPSTPKATQPNTKNITAQATQLHKNLLLSTPAPSQPTIKTSGNWYGNSATWTLTNGNLVVKSNGQSSTLQNYSDLDGYSFMHNLGLDPSNPTDQATAQSIKTLSFSSDGKVIAPSSCWRLFDDESSNWSGRAPRNSQPYNLRNLQLIDLRNLDLTHTTNYGAMFGGLQGLTNVVGLSNLPSDAGINWMFCADPSLTTVDLSKAININTNGSNNDNNLFNVDNKLKTITLGNKETVDKSSNIPNNGEWTDLYGNHVTLTASQHNKLYDANPNPNGNDTWTVGDKKPANIAKEKIIYINSENGQQIKTAKSDYPDPNNSDTSDGYVTGVYGTQPTPNWWKSYGVSNKNNGYAANNNVQYGWHVVMSDPDIKNFTINNTQQSIHILPNPKQCTINYMHNNNKIGTSGTVDVDSDITGAENTDLIVKSHSTPNNLPKGYYVNSDQKFSAQQLQHDNYTENVQVQPIEDYLNYRLSNDTSDIIATSSDIPDSNGYIGGSDFTVSSQRSPYATNFPFGYHIVGGDGISISNNNNNNPTNNDRLKFTHQNGSHKVFIAPNTITVNYVYGSKTISSSTATYNSKNKIYDNFAKPAGYQLASDQSNNQLSFDNNGGPVSVKVTPIQKTDIINYMNGSHKVSSASFTGDDDQVQGASNTSFKVTSAPTDYHIASNATTTFKYNGGTYPVSVVPNSVTNIIYYEGTNYSSEANVSGLYNTPSSVSAPYGYHYTNGKGSFTYGVNSSASHTFSVAPNPASETINYIYNNGSNHNEGSTVMSGHYNESGNANGTSGLSSGYQLVSKSNPFTYANGSASMDVNVKPLSASGNVLYQYNGKTISSSEISGNDYHATDAGNNTFSINNYVAPNGYHITSDSGYLDLTSNVNIVYNRSSYSIPVAPNRDTDTVDYQANGSTLASQEFSGNDEHATQAGDNSFDVTANNDSNIPNGYELVNNDNNFGFDNGTHDVAIRPIPQPAPFIPSMPTSVVSSASSIAYVPASESSTISKPSNEATPSHYRYAKVVTPLQLHTSKHFTDKNGVLTIKHPTEFRIMKIVHDHKYTRYEVSYNHKNYFITANSKFTINDYVQKHDFKNQKHMMVRVITPLIEYKRSHFSKKYAIKVFKRGTVLPVKRVFNIGKGEMTRFQLTNDRFVTSNKLFVKVIK